MSTRLHILAASAVVALAVTSIPASAQQVLEPVRVTAEADRAERQAVEAAAAATAPRHFAKAARLYERSAAERSANDPKAADALRKAALLHYYGGDLRRSITTMERAAQRAATIGDVVNAANSFIDAAIVANEMREQEWALALGRNARLLTSSPLLSDAQRMALRGRMTGWAEVASLQ